MLLFVWVLFYSNNGSTSKPATRDVLMIGALGCVDPQVCVYVYVSVCMRVCVCVLCVYVCMYVCIFLCMHACVYRSVCVCIKKEWLYVFMYI